MPLIEAALAFAITMLALSLVVSSIVEIIHRVFSMREAGLKYMLGQMFDQVLNKYLTSEQLKKLVDTSNIPDALKSDTGKLAEVAKKAFVERMSANRAPMGVTPKATPTDKAGDVEDNKKTFLGLWNGRDLADMTPTEFMERLGSIDVGQEIVKAVSAAGENAAGAVDVVLKGIAQKFEAFGKEASSYFEGRARLLSVGVAVLLAFAAHVDAVDLFKTYLRDPNARQKVIDQTEAVTAQHKAALESAKLMKELGLTAADVGQQIEAIKKDWEAAVVNANKTVAQYADLGAPIGWTPERIKTANMSHWVWTCKDDAGDDRTDKGWTTLWGECKDKRGAIDTRYRAIWVQVPKSLPVYFYLVLGGLLIGLGSPFWYSAVTALTNIRNTARGISGEAEVQSRAAVHAVEAGRAQPVTPLGSFQVSFAAQPKETKK